jgi:hypothetical protein
VFLTYLGNLLDIDSSSGILSNGCLFFVPLHFRGSSTTNGTFNDDHSGLLDSDNTRLLLDDRCNYLEIKHTFPEYILIKLKMKLWFLSVHTFDI